jgi:hypothetical protein
MGKVARKLEDLDGEDLVILNNQEISENISIVENKLRLIQTQKRLKETIKRRS